MNWIGLLGPVATFVLTELFNRNPKMKAHAPLVVTILSAVVGVIQAALTASPASAAVVAVAAGPSVTWDQYAMQNAVGGILLHNGAKKWLVEYAVNTLLKKLLKF